MTFPHRVRRGLTLTLVVALAACGDDDDPVAAEPYDLDLRVPANTIGIGQDSTTTITPTVVETNRDIVLPTATFVYRSSDTTVATASPGSGTGAATVRGIRPGTATITVSYWDPFAADTLREEVEVTVRPNLASETTLPPSTMTRHPGDDFTLRVIVLDADGDTVYCNTCTPPVLLRNVSFTAVEGADKLDTLTPAGRVEVEDSTGTVRVAIRIPGATRATDIVDTVTINLARRPATQVIVEPDTALVYVGATTDFDATLVAENEEVLTGREVVWTSSNENVATVDADGTVTAVAPGIATITATSTLEPVSGTAVVDVRAAP